MFGVRKPVEPNKGVLGSPGMPKTPGMQPPNQQMASPGEVPMRAPDPKATALKAKIRSNRRSVCGMKTLNMFFICIIVVPLTLGILLVTVMEALMIRIYFRMMIDNISKQIQEQSATIQSEIFISNQFHLANIYNKPLMELFRVRRLLLGSIPLHEKLIAKSDIKDDIKCLNTANINYKGKFPPCVDMRNIGSYIDKNNNNYKRLLAHANAVLNGDLNAKRDVRPLSEWKTKDPYKKDFYRLMILAPVLMAFPENRLNLKYDKYRYKRSSTVVASPNGIILHNYFNFELLNEQEVKKEECKGLHSDLTFSTIKFDPRCRPWYTEAIEFGCNFLKQKLNSQLELNSTNNRYPFVATQGSVDQKVDLKTNSPIESMTVMISMLHFYQLDSSGQACDIALKKVAEQNEETKKTYVIAKQIYVYQMLNRIAASVSQAVTGYFRYYKDAKESVVSEMKTKLDKISKKYKENPDLGKRYTETGDYYDWLKELAQKTGDPYRFFMVHLTHQSGKFKYKIMIDSWSTDFYSKNPPAGLTADQQKLDKIQKEEIEKFIDTNMEMDSENPVEKYSFEFSVGLKEKKKVTMMTQVIGVSDPTTKEFKEVFRTIVLLPDYLISKQFEDMIVDMNSQIFTKSIISFCIVVVVLLVGLVVVVKFGSKTIVHLNETLEVAEKVEAGEEVVQNKDDAEKNMNFEIMEAKNSLFGLSKVFSSSNSTGNGDGYNDGGESYEDKNVLRYAYRLRLFNLLDDKPMIGILSNNLGNLHFRAGRYLEAYEKYQESIDVLDAYSRTLNDDSIMSDEKYQTIRNNRSMNQAYALKKFIETLNVRDFQKLDRLKKIISILKDKISDTAHQRHIKCSVLLAWVSRNKDEISAAVAKIEQASDRYAKFKAVLDPNVAFLQGQEIDYEKACLSIKEKKYMRALILVTQALTRDERFEMGMRIQLVKLLVDIFKLLELTPTPGVIDLKERFLSPTTIKKYVIALDYSGSMRYGNKIENSISVILEIWDQYIRKNDRVAFVRFNINCEVIFGLEQKSINSFAKRAEIEKSAYPKDRTSFFDTVYKCCKLLNREKSERYASKSYVIIFCDGDDTSSLVQQKDCLEMLESSNVSLIAVGLNLGQDTRSRNMMETAAKASKGGVYIDIYENNFELFFQVISQYANNKPYTELNTE